MSALTDREKLALIEAAMPQDVREFIATMRAEFGARVGMVEAGGARIETREHRELYACGQAVAINPDTLSRPKTKQRKRGADKKAQVQQLTRYK